MWRMSLVLAVTVGGLFVAGCESSKASVSSRTELDKLQGTWQLVSGTVDGRALPDDEVRRTQIVTRGNTFVFPNAAGVGTSARGTFTVNPDTTPKQVDSTATDGPNAGRVSRGLYEVSGDNQRTAFGPPGSGTILQVWRRIGP